MEKFPGPGSNNASEGEKQRSRSDDTETFAIMSKLVNLFGGPKKARAIFEIAGLIYLLNKSIPDWNEKVPIDVKTPWAIKKEEYSDGSHTYSLSGNYFTSPAKRESKHLQSIKDTEKSSFEKRIDI